MEATPSQLPEIAFSPPTHTHPAIVSGDQSDAGMINERITHIQRASTLLSNPIEFVLYGVSLLFVNKLVLLFSLLVVHNFFNSFTIDRAEEVRPFTVIAFLMVLVCLQKFCKLDVRFVRRFIPAVDILEENTRQIRSKNSLEVKGYLKTNLTYIL